MRKPVGRCNLVLSAAGDRLDLEKYASRRAGACYQARMPDPLGIAAAKARSSSEMGFISDGKLQDNSRVALKAAHYSLQGPPRHLLAMEFA